MRYQVLLAEDWVEIKDGEILDSPWGTKALLYELFDRSGGYTLHWRAVDETVTPDKTRLTTEFHLPEKKTSITISLTVRSLSLWLLSLGEGIKQPFSSAAHGASQRAGTRDIAE